MKYLFLAITIFLSTSKISAQKETVAQDIRVNAMVYGTLLKPKTSTNTLVVIIGDSGPTDRNGNQQMQQNNALKMLAQGLAQEDIASFRYDKRILTLLKQQALQEEKLRFDDFIEDAENAINHFAKKEAYKNIYGLGHSQGALVGMIAAQQTEVSGFISLAGAGQSMDQLIVNQIGLQMPKLKDETMQALATLKEKGKVKDFNPALTSILRPSVQPFMASWMQYNPTEEIKKIEVPVLILNGDKDLQVATQEAQILKEAVPDAQFEIIKNMNHVLKTVTGGDLENSKTYNNTTLPLTETLVPTITQFIQKN